MLKIGILSYSENSSEQLRDIVEEHSFCKLIGVSQNNKISMIDDKYKYISNTDDLINACDTLILNGVSSSTIENLIIGIKKTKHIYVVNAGRFTKNDSEKILKLSGEAGNNTMFSQPYRFFPAFGDLDFHSQFPLYINIQESRIPEGKQSVLYQDVLEKMDLLLMFSNSSVYKISACFKSDSVFNVRLEFDNAVDANIMINLIDEKEIKKVEFLSENENIKIDLKRGDLMKISEMGSVMKKKPNQKQETFDLIWCIQKEFGIFIDSIVSNIDIPYSISNFHMANKMTDEVLRKNSIVLT